MWPTPSETPLDKDVYHKHYEHLYMTGNLNPEILEHMDKWQLSAIKELKKCQDRITRRGHNLEIHD